MSAVSAGSLGLQFTPGNSTEQREMGKLYSIFFFIYSTQNKEAILSLHLRTEISVLHILRRVLSMASHVDERV
jgi:hypothetical protein